MPAADLIRKYFSAYENKDRKAVESLLSNDFVFTSPYDYRIDRETYFKRCWPYSEQSPTYRSTASATILLANDGLFSMTTMPAKPMMESSSPVLPNFLFGIGFALLPACSACARGSSIWAELTKPAAVPIFKNSRLSMATPFVATCF
jgi:Domain of unknown function (DUF4440)